MKKNPSRVARGQHGRNVEMRGGSSLFGARITIRHRRGHPLTFFKGQDYCIAYVSRGELRKLRDCADRILGDRPRKRRAQ